MIKLYDGGVYLVNGETIIPQEEGGKGLLKLMTGWEGSASEAARGTMAYRILKEHNQSDDEYHTQQHGHTFTEGHCAKEFVGLLGHGNAVGFDVQGEQCT